MWGIFYSIWVNQGFVSLLIIGQFSIIVWLFKKLFGNHLKHLQADLKAIIQNIEELDKKVETTNEKTQKLTERVSKIEGKIDK
jgi:uncharacterized protein Yka (UPF0111/DUF47 family)